MSKPIVVQVTKDGPEWPKGAELGYANEAAAKAAHGDNYKVLRHTDTSEYVSPARVTDGPSTETTDAKAKK